MGDYKYVMGVGTLILLLAYMIGPMGAASTLVPDQDVGPGGQDFDTDRLQFDLNARFSEQPEPEINLNDTLDSDSVEIRDNGYLYWDETVNDRGNENGYAVYDISDRENEIEVSYYNSRQFGNDIEIVVGDDTQDWNEFEGEVLLIGNPAVIDPVDYDWMEVRIADEGLWGTSHLRSITDYSDQTGEENAFDRINNFLAAWFAVVAQIPSVIFAWLAFATILPGGIGYVAIGFVSLFALYLLIKDVISL